MFKFSLPPGTVLVAVLPHGTEQRLVHLGEGRFVSDIPPIVFDGVKLDAAAHEPAPACWDEAAATRILCAEQELKGFDVESTAASVRFAAGEGHVRAKVLMAKMQIAETMVKARVDAPKDTALVVADASGNVTGSISMALARSGGDVKIIC